MFPNNPPPPGTPCFEFPPTRKHALFLKKLSINRTLLFSAHVPYGKGKYLNQTVF